MKNYNKFEKTGTILSIIGFLCFLSNKFYPLKSLATFTYYGEILIVVGLVIWIYGRWKRTNKLKNEMENK